MAEKPQPYDQHKVRFNIEPLLRRLGLLPEEIRQPEQELETKSKDDQQV